MEDSLPTCSLGELGRLYNDHPFMSNRSFSICLIWHCTIKISTKTASFGPWRKYWLWMNMNKVERNWNVGKTHFLKSFSDWKSEKRACKHLDRTPQCIRAHLRYNSSKFHNNFGMTNFTGDDPPDNLLFWNSHPASICNEIYYYAKCDKGCEDAWWKTS